MRVRARVLWGRARGVWVRAGLVRVRAKARVCRAAAPHLRKAFECEMGVLSSSTEDLEASAQLVCAPPSQNLVPRLVLPPREMDRRAILACDGGVGAEAERFA